MATHKNEGRAREGSARKQSRKGVRALGGMGSPPVHSGDPPDAPAEAALGGAGGLM